jgi:copper(I)-binding protein
MTNPRQAKPLSGASRVATVARMASPVGHASRRIAAALALIGVAFGAPLLAFSAGAATADTVTAGMLAIEGAWARPTPEGTSISAGYVKITNHGDAPDVLLGASTPAANSAELHESAMTADGVMTMRPLENGLEIKPGETVELKPAGAHIMILGVKEPLKDGQTIPVTLNFKTAGPVAVTFPIKPLGGSGEHAH